MNTKTTVNKLINSTLPARVQDLLPRPLPFPTGFVPQKYVTPAAPTKKNKNKQMVKIVEILT